MKSIHVRMLGQLLGIMIVGQLVKETPSEFLTSKVQEYSGFKTLM